jgi:hypothetical protein
VGDGIRVGDGWGKERVTGGRVKGGRQEVGLMVGDGGG